MLQMKYDIDWPAGLRDIHVLKCDTHTHRGTDRRQPESHSITSLRAFCSGQLKSVCDIVMASVRLFLFVWFCSLLPSQQFFSYVETGFPGMNQYQARINVSCLRTQQSDAVEARTRNPHSQVKGSTTETLPSLCLSILLSPPKLLDEIQPNLVWELLTWSSGACISTFLAPPPGALSQKVKFH